MNINDIPPLEKIALESDLGHGPHKVRGVGEHSNLMRAPAVANAIQDAVGVRIPTLPITAERVHQQLRAIG
jgi:carbon-monoxide dehydrogenase large subunit